MHGLAVYGSHQGAVMEIEAAAEKGGGHVYVTGIVEEEEMNGGGRTLKRASSARVSAEMVEAALRRLGYLDGRTDVRIHFPGGMPVDGPSAGAAMAAAAVSALTGRPADGKTAVTGEIGLTGTIRPVGGVPEKIEAARRAGLKRVIVPRENGMERFREAGIRVILADTVQDVLKEMLLPARPAASAPAAPAQITDTLAAAPRG